MESHILLRGAAVRTNALLGTDAVALQTTYSTLPLTDAVFISSIFPMTAYIDALVQKQGQLSRAIALSADRTARAYLRSETAPLASGASIPSTDVNGAPIIGNLGDVIDGTVTTQKLTRKPVATLLNYQRAPGIFLVPRYNYALASGQILHTRTTVTIECCVFDADAQTAVYANNDDFTLDDSLAEAVICGACAMLMRDDEFVDQATRWAAYFATALAGFPPAIMEAQAA
jgi:hypothetical protein